MGVEVCHGPDQIPIQIKMRLCFDRHHYVYYFNSNVFLSRGSAS